MTPLNEENYPTSKYTLEALELATKAMQNKSSTEPALTTGFWTSSTAVVLATLIHVLFPKLLDTQVTAIVAAIGLLLPIITSILVRFKVYSPASVAKVINHTTRTTRQTLMRSIEEANKPIRPDNPEAKFNIEREDKN